jgi:hypothetical protein
MDTINEEEKRRKQEQEVIVVTLASKTELVELTFDLIDRYMPADSKNELPLTKYIQLGSDIGSTPTTASL